MMMMVGVTKEEDVKKGPWTEEEDTQLMCFVRLFGERRWDFIARVSGLKRTGKSCRLRWVNYLHPGLKRGRMSPQEQRLVLELHSLWGNKWSRIARKLPGRTDNEIKNYWRTHMRKKAQDKKINSVAPSTNVVSTSSSYSSSSLGPTTQSEGTQMDLGSAKGNICYPIDKVWDEIASSEMSGLTIEGSYPYKGEVVCHPHLPPPSSSVTPLWDYTHGSSSGGGELWNMDGEDKMDRDVNRRKTLVTYDDDPLNSNHIYVTGFPC